MRGGVRAAQRDARIAVAVQAGDVQGELGTGREEHAQRHVLGRIEAERHGLRRVAAERPELTQERGHLRLRADESVSEHACEDVGECMRGSDTATEAQRGDSNSLLLNVPTHSSNDTKRAAR